MTSEEIDSHSYAYLFEMYKEYPNRACENLGVSPDKEDEDKKSNRRNKNSRRNKRNNNVTLNENDYPMNLKTNANEAKEIDKLYNGNI